MVTSSAAERRPSDVTPRCFRELDSIMFYSEGRHSPVPWNCVPARPARAAAACGCPETGPGSWPRAAAPRPLHSRDTPPRILGLLLHCSTVKGSRLVSSSRHQQQSWGWGWMLKRTKNKMFHFFADVHCTSTSKHTAVCPPDPGRDTFVYTEAIRAECPD